MKYKVKVFVDGPGMQEKINAWFEGDTMILYTESDNFALKLTGAETVNRDNDIIQRVAND